MKVWMPFVVIDILTKHAHFCGIESTYIKIQVGKSVHEGNF